MTRRYTNPRLPLPLPLHENVTSNYLQCETEDTFQAAAENQTTQTESC